MHRSHPSETSKFAALPDAELLELGERIMLGEGPPPEWMQALQTGR